MNGRIKALTAVGTAAALCLGTWEVASATTRQAALSPTKAVNACATSSGNLQLRKSSGGCASGLSKVSLARQALAPRAVTMNITSGGDKSQKLALIANTTLSAECHVVHAGPIYAEIAVHNSSSVQIDGTAFVGTTGAGAVNFVRDGGGQNATASGASSVYAQGGGGFRASISGNGFATINTQLIVKVPGAVFTVNEVIDVNNSVEYCRLSAVVESVATN